jgi:hypothetical protein
MSQGSWAVVTLPDLPQRRGDATLSAQPGKERRRGVGGTIRDAAPIWGLARHASPGQILNTACVKKASVARMTALVLAFSCTRSGAPFFATFSPLTPNGRCDDERPSRHVPLACSARITSARRIRRQQVSGESASDVVDELEQRVMAVDQLADLLAQVGGGVARTTRRRHGLYGCGGVAAPRRRSRRVASRYLGRVEIPSCPAVFRTAPARPEGLRTSTSGLCEVRPTLATCYLTHRGTLRRHPAITGSKRSQVP